MIENLLNLYNEIPLNKFRKQISVLKSFVTDEQWLKILSFDFALNPIFANQIVNFINNINKQKITKLNMELVISEIRLKIEELLVMAEKETNIVFKWLKYREIYAYYGFLETIIEGSVITDYIFTQFKEIYGNDYIFKVKNIDLDNPSQLTNGASNCQKNEYNEIVNLYLLMKHWQDVEHIFNNDILMPKYLKTKQTFNKQAYREKPYLKNISDISLIYLYLIDNMPIVKMNTLARLLLSGNGEFLSKVIGGKMYGLTLLFINGFKIPETYVIPMSAIINKTYLNTLRNLKYKKFAIRSSANCEDGANFSFAGLFLSRLNIKKSNIEQAIYEVSASVDCDKVKAYLAHFNLEKPSMAVIIQSFNKPDKSGVWIGNGITSGSLEWIDGTGDLLVSGHAIPNRENWKNGKGLNRKYLKIGKLFIGNECLKIQKKLKICADIEWCIVDKKLMLLQLRPVTKKVEIETSPKSKRCILGTPASPGTIIGAPRFLKDFNDKNFRQGEILLADFTDPEWLPIILKAKAIVTAEGGALSHTAIIARELGIPAVVGVGYKNIDLLKLLKSINVNGTNGEINFQLKNNKKGN